MTVSSVLLVKIVSMLFMVLLGAVLVRAGKLKSEDAAPASNILLYAALPCSILSAFQVDVTPDVVSGLLLSFALGSFYFAAMLPLSRLMRKTLRLTRVEELSVYYSNTGYLTFPLVTAVFGEDHLIYAAGFFCASVFFQFTHGISTMRGENRPNVRAIVTNINIWAALIGIAMMFGGLRFPSLVQDTLSTVGSMIGPLSMLITGMLIGGRKLSDLLTYRRLPLVLALRLLIVPVLFILFYRLVGAGSFAGGGDTVVLISLFALAAPSAATVVQFAAIFGEDAAYASAINLVSTVCCVVTMPLMVLLYQAV